MGEKYELPGGLRGVRRPSVGDLILDREESKRHSKTFFRNDEIALQVEFILSHAEGLIQLFHDLHLKQKGQDLTDEEILKLYKGVKRWGRIHQGTVEHMASTEGFSVVAAVRAEQTKTLLDQKAAPDSSITGGPKLES